MNEFEKAEDRLKHFNAPFSDDSLDAARAKVMARTIYAEEVSEAHTGFRFNRFYAAAATLALIISLPFLVHFIGNTTLTAEENSGKHLLPDGSEVMLAEGSSISFNSILWYFARTTSVDGEVFFSVESGDQFTVETTFGNVTVLGTQFSVWENEDALVVHCQEGKVDVEGKILEANDYIVLSPEQTSMGKWTKNSPFISTTANQLTFENTPIQIVIESLEKEFSKDIQFSSNSVYRFSGSLMADDFESSLEILTKPFGLEISSDKGRVVILEP
jgi:ferric-dicitrate binding protein FerR (iron transport regulator)